MHDRDKIDQLNHLVDGLLAPNEPKRAGREEPPFDLAAEAQHSTKREFLDELTIVKGIIKHLNAILELIPDDHVQTPQTNGRLKEAVDKAIRNGTRRRKLRGGSSLDLAIQNIRETGFFECSREILRDMVFAYQAILEQLVAQEEMFWSMPHRPPDHFARIIALRFARLFHHCTGNNPSFGTSSQGGHPSTKFGLALEKIFEILDIKRDIRPPAEWAIAQFEKERREQEERDAKEYSRQFSMGAYREDLVNLAVNGSRNSRQTPE